MCLVWVELTITKSFRSPKVFFNGHPDFTTSLVLNDKIISTIKVILYFVRNCYYNNDYIIYRGIKKIFPSTTQNYNTCRVPFLQFL